MYRSVDDIKKFYLTGRTRSDKFSGQKAELLPPVEGLRVGERGAGLCHQVHLEHHQYLDKLKVKNCTVDTMYTVNLVFTGSQAGHLSESGALNCTVTP